MIQIMRAPGLPGTVEDPLYPHSDGKPMGETDFHVDAIILLRQGLEDWFATAADVYVTSNMFFYFEHGNPRGRRDPDVLVARGVGKHRRLSYRLWEEGVVPQVLFEISSRKTWREDLYAKRELYARLGVSEYFLFDPDWRYLDPPLQGFRLENGVSVPIAANADGSLHSQELGLDLKAEGVMIRLRDARTGKPVLTRVEQIEQQRERAAEQRGRAAAEKQRAEAEKRLAKEEKRRADAAKRRAESAKRRAEKEKRRAEDLAAEVERLRALLRQRPDADT